MKRWQNVKDVINLTPHDVSVMCGDTMKRLPPSGRVVRTTMNCEPCGEVDGMPVVLCHEGEPRGMPEPKEGTVYIVSSVVAKSLKRRDVLSPDTSDDGVIRDGGGRIMAVKRLQVFI